MATSRPTPAEPARWLAAAAALAGAGGLALLCRIEEVELAPVTGAVTLLVGGTIYFIRLSIGPSRWARAVAGPEARRFLAIALGAGCLMLLAGAVVLMGWVFRPGE